MQGSSQFRLLAERRFGPFFGVQFLGAFNDNVFKQALVILPFFLFSATTGQIADKVWCRRGCKPGCRKCAETGARGG